MKITLLGQAGILLQTARTAVLADPYFTDSAFGVSGIHRRIPVPESVWDIKPDVVLFTHDHIDHYDPETAARFINEKTRVTVLSPRSVWEKVRENGGKNEYVLVSPDVAWTHGDTEITAVKAAHSDPYAVGFVIAAEGKRVYITGDTLYFNGVRLPFESVDCVFLPINGRGNNMNVCDASRFASQVNAKHAVPIHYGMLDDIDPRTFEYNGRVIMEYFKEYEI
ncbi:MAG: MBL fold metallo-hydrolase [Clostridia bacterium]|nr:MBL fold metallo-hydrolase [Clostridia bacterium]